MDKQGKALFTAIGIMLAIMWGIFIIDWVLPMCLGCWLGVYPRSISGLLGIATFSFAHGSWTHLISNSLPFFMLSLLVAYSVRLQGLIMVWILGGLGSGLGVWLFSSADLVVGASGIVFALIGFVLGRIYFQPTVQNAVLAVMALFMYSGALYSLFSFQEGVSWVGHASGLVAGIISSAILLRRS